MKRRITSALFGWLASLQLLQAQPTPPNASLFQAIRNGDSALVAKLLSRGADLRALDNSGNTPLMAAAMLADLQVLELLLDAGAPVNATNAAGATALMRAATFEDKTRLLLARGAEVKARSELGNTALLLAARKPGNSVTVKVLLDRGAEVRATNVLGATALMAAAAAADLDSVRLLLDGGEDVNAKPNMDGDGFIWAGGRTPLMWASFLGNEPLVQLLLERGARVNDFTLAGGALAQAAWGGHVGTARILLDAGASVDARDLIANYTPLHWAASSELASPALVELLLARGADASAEGGQTVDNFLGASQTPLMLARKRGETAIVRALLAAKAREEQKPVSERVSNSVVRPLISAGTEAVVEAIRQALPPLTKTSEQSHRNYLRHASKQDCVACHQQQLPLAAISLANSRQIETDRDAARNLIGLLQRDIAEASISQADPRHRSLEASLQTTFHPEPAIFDGYTTLALRFAGEPASGATDSLVHQLATIQHRDGHWSWNLPRPPIQASDISATALAVYTLESWGMPGRRKELDSRLQRARGWLAQARAETNEERAYQLLGLAWAGETPEGLKKWTEALIRDQRPDGGWGQLVGLPSDAFATGQSLYALITGGRLAATEPEVRQGLVFLLRSQLADGTWHVRRRAHPFQPPMDSGFPHGADGWISSSGSSWAVLALAASLDPGQKAPPPKTASLATTPPAATTTRDIVEVVPDSRVEFARDIQPLLERSCVACHHGERAKGGFHVTDRLAFLRGGARGEAPVVPGKPGTSPLLHIVQDEVQDLEMPPLAKRGNFPALSKDEIGKLRGWIAQGADWPQGTTLRVPVK